MFLQRLVVLGSTIVAFLAGPCRAEETSADLLIVGANEAGCAAAVQAARLGVAHIVLTNDISWLGGQFSAEAVGAIDEWTVYRGKRVNFPRSGLFLEVIERVREYNGRTYGMAAPGNAFCASETIEPAAAARIFEELLAPYSAAGSKQITVARPVEPLRVELDGNRVAAVVFRRGDSGDEWTVRARLTIDCSDWGDVIRASGAAYAAGPDLKSRYGEPNAPEGPLPDDRNEMNPLTWNVVLREAGRDVTISKPEGYDPARYTALDTAPAFVDSAAPEGIYSAGNLSVYTHRRLVDRWHNRLPEGTEATFLCWPTQDYPLYNFPRRVVDALEANEPGASRKNIVDMTPVQRQIVFADARRHALGMLYHLQTKVHDRVGDYPQSFRYMRLTDEFGTPDQLPPKPYVREGLRLEALYVLREQDIRAESSQPRWARVMPPDAVFGFQFNIDFHPTRRKFVDGNDPAGPWRSVHTANRNWSTHTDRAMFPLRGLVPIERDGLLRASKNIGVSSIVSSALRLHGQMMACGQAAGTLAWLCLRDEMQPRQLARDWPRIRELQQRLARGPHGKPGVLLWPFHDLRPDDDWFEAVNLLAVRGILVADPDDLDFGPWREVRQAELTAALVRAGRSLEPPRAYVAPRDADGNAIATWNSLYQGLRALGLPAGGGLRKQGKLPLVRGELARNLWWAIRDLPEWSPDTRDYLAPGHDADGDGQADLDDGQPFDRDNDHTPDRFDAE